MSKQKRMFYVYEENLAFYDSLTNKSQFLNDALQDARLNVRIKNPEPSDANKPEDYVDPRIAATRKSIAEMEQRDAEALRKYREK